MNHLRFLLPVLALPAAAVAAPEPALEKRLPLQPEIRQVLDRSCILCHGENIQGGKEVRGDLDLTSDGSIRATLADLGKFKYYIETDKMPHKPRLSRRLRADTVTQERLAALKEAYSQNGDKAILLAWLADVEAKKPADQE